jgi:hypothetical protein
LLDEWKEVQQSAVNLRRIPVRYTIEARQLTNEYTPQRVTTAERTATTVEAGDDREAISNFLLQSQAELVSFQTLQGRESIATVKKDDSVFLVRVYAA